MVDLVVTHVWLVPSTLVSLKIIQVSKKIQNAGKIQSAGRIQNAGKIQNANECDRLLLSAIYKTNSATRNLVVRLVSLQTNRFMSNWLLATGVWPIFIEKDSFQQKNTSQITRLDLNDQTESRGEIDFS